MTKNYVKIEFYVHMLSTSKYDWECKQKKCVYRIKIFYCYVSQNKDRSILTSNLPRAKSSHMQTFP